MICPHSISSIDDSSSCSSSRSDIMMYPDDEQEIDNNAVAVAETGGAKVRKFFDDSNSNSTTATLDGSDLSGPIDSCDEDENTTITTLSSLSPPRSTIRKQQQQQTQQPPSSSSSPGDILKCTIVETAPYDEYGFHILNEVDEMLQNHTQQRQNHNKDYYLDNIIGRDDDDDDNGDGIEIYLEDDEEDHNHGIHYQHQEERNTLNPTSSVVDVDEAIVGEQLISLPSTTTISPSGGDDGNSNDGDERGKHRIVLVGISKIKSMCNKEYWNLFDSILHNPNVVCIDEDDDNNNNCNKKNEVKQTKFISIATVGRRRGRRNGRCRRGDPSVQEIYSPPDCANSDGGGRSSSLRWQQVENMNDTPEGVKDLFFVKKLAKGSSRPTIRNDESSVCSEDGQDGDVVILENKKSKGLRGVLLSLKRRKR